MFRHLTCIAAIGLIAAAPANALATVTDTIHLSDPSLLSFTDTLGMGYSLTATDPTTSGSFNTFLNIQRDGDEQGYNSSKNTGSHSTMDNRPLDSGESPQLNLNNILTDDYSVLLRLDLDEAKETRTIYMNELMLVVSTDSDKTGPQGPHGGTWSIQSMPLSPGDQVIYQMSAATDGAGNSFVMQFDDGNEVPPEVNLNLSLANVANLASLLDGDHYLYVYSRFSDSDTGAESWQSFERSSCGPPLQLPGGGVPEPASLCLLGLGAMGLLVRRAR